MKKIIVLIIILFLLSVSSLLIIGTAVDSQNDTITITEELLYGDKSIAEGITITSSTHYDNHLFWTTEYTAGKNPKTTTDYKFYASEPYQPRNNKYFIFEIDTDIRYGFDAEKPTEEQVGLSKIYKELYDSCELGQRAETTVALKDIYDYYPLRLNITIPNIRWTNNNYELLSNEEPGGEKYVVDKFREFFRIPILDKHEVHISVGKYHNGMSVGSGTVDNAFDYYTSTISTHTDDEIFFTIRNKTYLNQYADFSLVPGGYGIYSFKYSHNPLISYTGIDADSLSNVYPLDPEMSVEYLDISADEKYMIMVGVKEDDTIFTVIDLETMTEYEKIVIENRTIHSVKTSMERYKLIASGDFVDSTYNKTIKTSENFIILMFSEEFALIEISEEGAYELKFIAKQPKFIDENFHFMDYASEMVYDGEKLVIVNSFIPETGPELCSFYMAIYNAEGLKYYAQYNSSLDVNNQPRDHQYNCHPLPDGYTITLN